MYSAKLLFAGSAIYFGLAMPLQQAAAQEIKGQIKIGLHKVKLDQNKLYKITISGPPQLNVDCLEAEIMRTFSPNPADDKLYFIPQRTDDFTFAVTYGGFFGGLGSRPNSDTIDYTLKFNPVDLVEQPVLSVTDKLTGQDPIYKNQNKHFKAYPIQMTAGKTYIIDLGKGGVRDPYLYLEDARGQVASDDDGGDGLESRIIYSPTQNGQYTIIATTLGMETGGFTLTVRESK